MSVLMAGVDGWDARLADWYSHPFWESIRDEVTMVYIPKPGEIESGDIATASSPRLWGRLYTGAPPKVSGIAGFWERYTSEGDVVRAKKSWEWIRKNRVEKLVTREHMLVPPIWEHVANAGHSVGLSTPWFSYPLPDHLTDAIDKYGKWALGDFPFPKDHELMDRDRLVYPPDAWPGDDFTEEVGAGARVSILVQQDPEQFYEDLLTQDRDRYMYTAEQIRERGTPDFCTLLTRSTDGMAHQFRKDEDIRPHYPDRLRDGERNLKQVYDLNFDGIEELMEVGDFDHLLIGGDHQCGLEMTDDGPEFKGKDHEWPAAWAIWSPDFESQGSLEAKYEDIAPTILELLDISDDAAWGQMEGAPLQEQARVQGRLESLGYLPGE